MINKDDPRLTAYLLGELDEAGHNEVQAALAESAELRMHVDGLRDTIDTLHSALGIVPGGEDELSDQQIAAVEAAASVDPVAIEPLALGEEPTRIRWRRLAMAALLLYAVGMSVLALRPAKINPEVASSMLAEEARDTKKVAPIEPMREVETRALDESPADNLILDDVDDGDIADAAAMGPAETSVNGSDTATEESRFRMSRFDDGRQVQYEWVEGESLPRVVSDPDETGESITIGMDGISGLPAKDLDIEFNNGSFGVNGPAGTSELQDSDGSDVGGSGEVIAERSLDRAMWGGAAMTPRLAAESERSIGQQGLAEEDFEYGGSADPASGMGAMGGGGADSGSERRPRGEAMMGGMERDMMMGKEMQADMGMQMDSGADRGTAIGGRGFADLQATDGEMQMGRAANVDEMMDMLEEPQSAPDAPGDWATNVSRDWLESLPPPNLPAGEPAPTTQPADPAGASASSPQPAKPALLQSRFSGAPPREGEELAAIKPADAAQPANPNSRRRTIADEAKKKMPAAPKTWKPASASTNRARLSVGHHDDLLLAARDTYVRIDGFRARVMFDLYYYNDRGRQLEGQFMLRLPDDAALHYFAFGTTNLPTPAPAARARTTGKPGDDAQPEPFDPAAVLVSSLREQTESVGSDLARRASDAMYKAESNSTFGSVKTAYVAPRQKAALAYEETVRRRVDPALVEWAGPGIFQTKVFPLMPGKLHRIVVGYDVSLEDIENDRLFTLDLPEDEAGGRVEFDIVAAAGTRATLTPSADPFVSGGRAYYRYEGAAPRDYTARLSGTESIMIRHSDSIGGEYFATRVIADLPEQAAKVDSRQAVLMLDTSWSDRPAAFARRLELLEQILTGNRDSVDEFAVMMFNVHHRWWRKEFVANNDQNVKAFLEFANDLALEGATDLCGALTQATAPDWNAASDESLPHPNLFLLSDAVATWGATDLLSITAPLQRVNRNLGGGALFAYPFSGLPSDRVVMRMLADASGGSVFNVAEKAELATAATAHRSRPWQLAEVTAAGADEILVQGSAKTVYPGQPLLVAGRGELDGPVELVFKRGGETKTMTINPRLTVKSPAAARLYGGIAVDRLEPFAGDVEEITVAFARHFRVPGRTCSMVMLDSEQDYQRFGVNTSPDEDHLVIASTSVESLLDSQQSKLTGQRENSRERFVSWTESLESASLLTVSTALRLAINQMPESSFAFSPRPLECRSFRQSDFGRTYLDDLAMETPDFDSVMMEADQILISFGADDAIKAASTLVEAKPSDVETLRSVAFRAIEWKRGDQAAPLLWRITQARPHQPQCLMLLARSLAAGGDLDASIVCYDLVTGGNWNQRWASAKGIAKVELMSVLEQVDLKESSIAGYAKARLRQLRGEIAGEGLDVAVFMHWNTDRTDVDLHVTEPSGEECFYKNKSTKSGGQMTADITEGLGPEMYTLHDAPEGGYQIHARYFRSDQNRTKAPTEILVTLVSDLGRSTMKTQTKRLTLSGQNEKETVLRFRVQ